MNPQLNLKLTNTFLINDPRLETISNLAVAALINEAELTPKPGLVDKNSNGSHSDMNIQLMLRSANSLRSTFYNMAKVSYSKQPSETLLKSLAEIGLNGEKLMFAATSGVNTHKGAIWSIGLLSSATSISGMNKSPDHIAEIAGKLARFKEKSPESYRTNGTRVKKIYGASGAVGEAQEDFINVIKFSLPILQNRRKAKIPENMARLDALMALMANVNDTCILSRGGNEALQVAKNGANKVLQYGGAYTKDGFEELLRLNKKLINLNVSPGGCADLLAATLFLDSIKNDSKIQQY